jgi:hypothetical protein
MLNATQVTIIRARTHSLEERRVNRSAATVSRRYQCIPSFSVSRIDLFFIGTPPKRTT